MKINIPGGDNRLVICHNSLQNIGLDLNSTRVRSCNLEDERKKNEVVVDRGVLNKGKKCSCARNV